MTIVITVLVLLVIFGLLVGVHELGHFFAAKLQGMWVQEFAFGFGPNLFKKRYKDTLYRINAIPLGGYVKIFGDQELRFNNDSQQKFDKLDDKKKTEIDLIRKKNKLAKILDEEELRSTINSIKDVSDEDKDWVWLVEMNSQERIKNPLRYSNKPIINRIIVVCAGVFMNFVLGVLIYSIYLGFVQQPLILPNLDGYNFVGVDVANVELPILGSVYDEEFKKLENSLILSINGKKIEKITDFTSELEANQNKDISLKYFKAEEGRYYDATFQNSKEKYHTLYDSALLNKPVLFEILPDSAAKEAGLSAGDIIISIGEKEVLSADNYTSLLKEFNGQEKVTFKVMRADGLIKDVNVNLTKSKGDLILGASYGMNQPVGIKVYLLDYSHNIFGGLSHSVNILGYQGKVLGKYIVDAFVKHDVSNLAESINGPIRITTTINSFVKANNFSDIINITALISLSLAFMNILPLPIVDGGHVILLTLEAIRKRPLSERSQNVYNFVGMVIIIALAVVVTLKDLWQEIF